ncbi:hypothetical protein [Haladaptatus litoreus]|uniref:hypothetical protein n=1 Tax=Haladaptatus litoreus TaxID=553468 RepID=UPI0011159320|nr:hypothetical protein [Haladaptatus litoreus]
MTVIRGPTSVVCLRCGDESAEETQVRVDGAYAGPRRVAHAVPRGCERRLTTVVRADVLGPLSHFPRVWWLVVV